MSNSTLRINCYVRITKTDCKETGYVGRLGGICRDENTRRRLFGVDWASEYQYGELVRITPAEYHASPEHLKLSKGWMNRQEAIKNPLGLDLSKIADLDLDSMTKGQLAKLVLPPGLTFDYALPQEWLNRFSAGDEDLYYATICSCVTAYPQGSYFGVILSLKTGEIVASL